MRKFNPIHERGADVGEIIGYPHPGRYAVMVKDGRIVGGERERPGEFQFQKAALSWYYPKGAETVVVVLDESGIFTEQD